MTTSLTPDAIAKIKTGMRATWMAGDFGIVAKTISEGAEKFIASLHFSAGARVLDVACGTGNTTIPLAKQGCIVTGVDIAPNLLEQARQRAAEENVTAEFLEGDAEALSFPDASFEAYITMFGAMFAPRPELVASEAARVLKPGGVLAMANWNPASFTGKMFRTGATHVPPPAGVAPPVLWGDEATVRERLDPYFEQIETILVPINFAMPTTPAGAVEFFRKYFGPTQIAFSKLDATGQAALQNDLIALWTEGNISPDPEQVLVRTSSCAS